MVGAVLYGPTIGAFLGGVFGLIVIIMIVVGMDPASMVMMQFNAVGTVITCMVKGILAGLVPGLVYKMFAKTKKKKTGYVLASVCAPIMNTGFYVLMVITIFKGLMERYDTYIMPSGRPGFYRVSHMGLQTDEELVRLAERIHTLELEMK